MQPAGSGDAAGGTRTRAETGGAGDPPGRRGGRRPGPGDDPARGGGGDRGGARMTGVRVKICGLNSEAAFDAAVGAGADWVGFVFFPPSPRFVTPARAAALSARRPGGPPRVGLFVSPTEAAIAEVLANVPLDILQVYGAV